MYFFFSCFIHFGTICQCDIIARTVILGNPELPKDSDIISTYQAKNVEMYNYDITYLVCKNQERLFGNAWGGQ